MKLFKALKKEVSVKSLIHKALAGYEEPRPHGTIHASDLMKEQEFCPREWALMDLGVVKKRGSFIGTALRITFDHGRDMEWRLRNEWIRPHAVGKWSCGVCGHVYPMFGKAPKVKCPKCGWGHQWEYHEVRLLDPTSGISGGIDLLLDTGSGSKLRLIEIKSMDKDEHKKLAAPLSEHKFRTALYLKLADHSEMPESSRIDKTSASILYVSKSFGFKDTTLAENGIKDAPFSPFKEFTVTRDDDLVDIPVKKATALTLWRKMHGAGKAPGIPAGVCPNGLCKRAQQCNAIAPCFSGNFPAIITWTENGKPKHPGKPYIV